MISIPAFGYNRPLLIRVVGFTFPNRRKQWPFISRGVFESLYSSRAECSRRTIIKLEQGANVATHTLFRVLASLGMTMDIMEKRTDIRALRELQEKPD